MWGERSTFAASRSPLVGPSPRVWGELPDLHGREALITGHPHVCGENATRRGAELLEDYGPSPRVWGEHFGNTEVSPSSTPRSHDQP